MKSPSVLGPPYPHRELTAEIYFPTLADGQLE
jgi:hypothetical protein